MRRQVWIGAAMLAVCGACSNRDAPNPAKGQRTTSARTVGEAYAPKEVLRGSLPLGERSNRETPAPITELRNTAATGDATALTDLAAALLNTSDRYGELGEVVEAIDLTRRAIQKNPRLPAAHYNLGLALEQLALTGEARAAFEEAARLDADPGWVREAKLYAENLRVHDGDVEWKRITRYVAATGDHASRHILRPYIAAPTRRPVSDAVVRLRRAAGIYMDGVDPYINRVGRALQMLAADWDVEPLANRFYMAGALRGAGRDVEAEAWLGSVDHDIQQALGDAGLRAQLVWEQGLFLITSSHSPDALTLFEAAHQRSIAAGERQAAAMFHELAQAVRAFLVADELFKHVPAAAFRQADGSSLADIQSALAEDAAILRYSSAAPSEVVVFVVRRHSLDVVSLPTRHSTEVILLPRASGFQASPADRLRNADDTAFSVAAADLHDQVFAPVVEKLDGVSTIAIVPTPDLSGMPFGALFDANRGEYLAERFTIVHAQSAAQAVETSRRARDLRDISLLAIGANEFEDPLAEPLPSVNREVQEIAKVSRCARVYIGEQATPDAVEREIAESAIIHYAGHIVRRGASLLLLLARSGGRDTLSSREIAALRLEKPRVAVLAACRGAAYDPYTAMPSMAEAFLDAGVPTVIASAYDVDDAEAPPTMRRLHARLGAGADAAEALRQTTVEELRAGRGVPMSIRFHASGGASALVQ